MLTTNELIQEINHNLKTIINQSSLDRLPILNLKPNNEINRIVDFFGYFHVELPEGISEEEKTEILLDKLTEYMTASENKEYLSQLEKICGNFAIELNNKFDILSDTISPLVKEIYMDVNNKFESLLKRNNAENLISELATPETTKFEFLKWSGLSSAVINDTNTIDLVTDLCNIKNKELNHINANTALTKIIQPDFKEFDYKEIYETNKDIISNYFNENYKNINEDDADRYFKLVISKNAYIDFFIRQVKNSFVDIKSTVLNISKIVFDCNNFLDFYDTIKKHIELNVSEQAKQNILNNLNSVRNSCYISLFYCLYLKKSVFNGKLILSKTLINFPEFKKIEKAGLDLVFIASYLKAYYTDKPVPVLGIDTKSVIESTAKVKNDLQKINTQILMDKNIIFNKCLYNATKDVFINSFDKICDILGHTDELLLDTLKQRYFSKIDISIAGLAGNLGKVEDALYVLIMNTFYKDTLTYNMYTSINRNYLLMLTANKDINKDDIAEYTSKSLIELLCSFLSNYIE